MSTSEHFPRSSGIVRPNRDAAWPAGDGGDAGGRQVCARQVGTSLPGRQVDRDSLREADQARAREPVRFGRRLRKGVERRFARLARGSEPDDPPHDGGAADLRRQDAPRRGIQRLRRPEGKRLDADLFHLAGTAEVRSERQDRALGIVRLHPRQGRAARRDESGNAAVLDGPVHHRVHRHDGRRRQAGHDVGQNDGVGPVQGRKRTGRARPDDQSYRVRTRAHAMPDHAGFRSAPQAMRSLCSRTWKRGSGRSPSKNGSDRSCSTRMGWRSSMPRSIHSRAFSSSPAAM